MISVFGVPFFNLLWHRKRSTTQSSSVRVRPEESPLMYSQPKASTFSSSKSARSGIDRRNSIPNTVGRTRCRIVASANRANIRVSGRSALIPIISTSIRASIAMRPRPTPTFIGRASTRSAVGPTPGRASACASPSGTSNRSRCRTAMARIGLSHITTSRLITTRPKC